MAQILGFKTRTQTDDLEKNKKTTVYFHQGFLWGLFSALPVGA